MSRFIPRFQSPVHQALWTTGLMVVFGLAVRFIWGAYDPEMRRWTFVAIAPLMGAFTYLRSTGRLRLIAVGLIGLGCGALVFWTVVLALGGIPRTGGADYVYIALIFAFPVACVGLGWAQLRKLAAGARSRPPG